MLQRVPLTMLLGMVASAVRVITSGDKHRAIRRLNARMKGEGYELTDGQIEALLASMTTFHQRLPRPAVLSDEQVRRITAPCLLVLGEQTRLFDPRRVATRATSLMPDVTVEIIPGTGHGVLFQQPATVSGRVTDFLARHDG